MVHAILHPKAERLPYGVVRAVAHVRVDEEEIVLVEEA
jgi:hypothetical protein